MFFCQAKIEMSGFFNGPSSRPTSLWSNNFRQARPVVPRSYHPHRFALEGTARWSGSKGTTPNMRRKEKPVSALPQTGPPASNSDICPEDKDPERNVFVGRIFESPWAGQEIHRVIIIHHNPFIIFLGFVRKVLDRNKALPGWLLDWFKLNTKKSSRSGEEHSTRGQGKG